MDKVKTENTELEILEAAKDIFQQKGMDGARMQEIADKANINKALLHYYYRSKQLLFEAVFKSALSLNIFPFIGQPLLMALINVDKEKYSKILLDRKTEVSSFIINSIKI